MNTRSAAQRWHCPSQEIKMFYLSCSLAAASLAGDAWTRPRPPRMSQISVNGQITERESRKNRDGGAGFPPDQLHPPTTTPYPPRLVLVLMIASVRLMSCLAGKEKKEEANIPSSWLPPLMSRVSFSGCWTQKPRYRYEIFGGGGGGGADVGPPPLAK